MLNKIKPASVAREETDKNYKPSLDLYVADLIRNIDLLIEEGKSELWLDDDVFFESVKAEFIKKGYKIKYNHGMACLYW